MNAGALALVRAIHVLGVVIWIGGVGFVTAVLLPALRSVEDPMQRAELFEKLEGRFSWIARGAVLLVGASGFAMLQSARTVLCQLQPRYRFAPRM